MLEPICHMLKSTRGAKSCAKAIEGYAASVAVEASVIVNDEDTISYVHLRSKAHDAKHFLNGVIINGAGEVICRPPKRLTRISVDEFVRMAPRLNGHGRELIEAANGTVASLYWAHQRWCIATSRSVDASSMILIADVTLEQVFDSLFEDAGLSKDDLDTAYSYTFVICHRSYHIVPVNALHFIVAWSRRENKFASPREIKGLEAGVAEKLEASQQFRRKWSSERVAELCRSRPTHLFESLKLDATGTWGDAPPMGFIVRQHGAGPDYYIESEVMRFLRVNLYDHYKTMMSASVQQPLRRVYMLLHMKIASLEDPGLFDVIFRQSGTYNDSLDWFESIFEPLVARYAEYNEKQGGNLREMAPAQFYKLASEARRRGFGTVFKAELIAELFAYVQLYISTD